MNASSRIRLATSFAFGLIIAGGIAGVLPVEAQAQGGTWCMRADANELDWSGADTYGRGSARLLMEAIRGDATTSDLPVADGLYALVLEDTVLILRLHGEMICRGGTVDRSSYDAARRKVFGIPI